jgi:hypothetical protein
MGFLARLSIGCGAIVAIAFIVFFAMLLTTYFKKTSGASSNEPIKPLIISIEEMHRAFDKDQAAATEKFTGKPLLVTGKIEYIHENAKEKTISVGLYTGNRIPATARFGKQKDILVKLKEGQIIAFNCHFDKYSHVSLSNLHEYVPISQKITGLIPTTVLKILPDVSLIEIVHLKDCELVQWEQ